MTCIGNFCQSGKKRLKNVGELCIISTKKHYARKVTEMKESFGVRADGQQAYLYTITGGKLTAKISDHGATLVQLHVPDREGNMADVVLGFEDPAGYENSTAFHGAIVGRNANRVRNASFEMNGRKIALDPNDHGIHNLHSGFHPLHNRLWQVVEHKANEISLRLQSPDGDQGFPGNAVIQVTYALEADNILRITYDGICDKDTVFNMTNHSYFNLAGHEKTELALKQLLTMPARFFNPDDAQNIPTGECREVAGTPMDFRSPMEIGKRIGEDYAPLLLQGGYDHNFEVFANPCAILKDPTSGRCMCISTDCPGVQFYSGNFLQDEVGKNGAAYCRRGGIALETQYFPDSVNHPEWKQPFVKAGQRYHSETCYRFWAE